MTAALWVLEDDRIRLKLSTGETVEPTSADIFRAAFSRSTDWHGVPVGNPLVDLVDLSFSRAAAQPLLRVRASGAEITAELGVETAIGFFRVDVGRDQVVVARRWYPIHADALDEATAWLRARGIGVGGRLTVGQLVALRMPASAPFALLDEVTLTSSGLASSVGQVQDVPGFAGTLYPYQSEGVSFLQMISQQGLGCILADEMGLGKTAQVIALLQLEKNAVRGSSLVVAPATLLENWRRELGIFAPQLSVLVHSGAHRAGIAAALRLTDIVLVSYETAIRDEELLSAVNWNVVALDEAQNIKNPDAQRTATVKRIPRRVSVAITGTPLENRLDDLWSITDYALPGLLGGLGEFRAKFTDGVSAAASLAPIVAPVLLRRKVADVAQDLPERIEVPQPLLMSRSLADAYEKLRTSTIEEYGVAGGLVATTRLRMLCAHPRLMGAWASDPAFEMPKYARALELLEEVFSNGEKALVFSTYQDIADLFMSDVPARFPVGFFRHIDGRVEVAQRQPIVDAFFAFEGYGALFLNPKAAGTGLNITAANHVIHYNPEWNPALTAQASGRAYRRKQSRPVTIHHLFFSNTVEEVIRDAANFKGRLACEAVTGHDGNVDPLVIARAMRISPFAAGQEYEQ
jgi:SNF2 family DNA or RNA helicase